MFIAGAARTDFKLNCAKDGRTLRDLIASAGRAAIETASLTPGDVQSGVVGSFAAGLLTRQLHRGAFLTDIDPGLVGIPTLHTEAACASGSVAVLTAAHQIMAGVHDVVLVVDAEQQKTMPVPEHADVLAAAGDFHAERPRFGSPLFPKLFAEIAKLYARAHDVPPPELRRHLAIAGKNYAHAKLNPLSQTRNRPTLTLDAATTHSDKNPIIAEPLLLSDCSQITDGAAAIVLVSQSLARKLKSKLVRLLGYRHTTDHLTLQDKQVPEFPHARTAADRA